MNETMASENETVADIVREMHLFVSHLKDGVVTYEDKGAFSEFTSKQQAG